MRISKWHKLKGAAIELRQAGKSLRTIQRKLNIPKSTLGGWFQHVELSEVQRQKLHQDWMRSLARSRKKAVEWHRAQKRNRIAIAKEKALKTLSQIDSTDINTLELALAILYLGEGSKRTVGTALGSSDPVMLRFFIAALERIYKVSRSHMKAELHLRADQNIAEMKRRWSQELKLPLENFTFASIDKRTEGSPTYPNYLGVCNIRAGGAEIQRRLIFLSNYFCKKVVKDHKGS